MTPRDHYRDAERMAQNARHHLTEDPGDMRIAEVAAWIAQVHATLATATEAHRDDLGRATRALRRLLERFHAEPNNAGVVMVARLERGEFTTVMNELAAIERGELT